METRALYFCRRMTNTIAHRGARGYAAENTLESFQKALLMGVGGIELDVHLSSDHEIIVIHDESIDRTTNGSGLVRNLSLQQLRNYSIESKYIIPTLSEVFDMMPKNLLINVELKVAETALPVVRLIEKYMAERQCAYRQFLISSFDWTALQTVREQNPLIPIGVLTMTDLDLAVNFAEFIQAESIHPHYHLLSAENTREIQQKGIKVFTWTVNEPEDIAHVKTFKPDGIITDYPDRI